jgi:multisubunit Na+/H+ antiporter MnhC subunit
LLFFFFSPFLAPGHLSLFFRASTAGQRWVFLAASSLEEKVVGFGLRESAVNNFTVGEGLWTRSVIPLVTTT